MRDFRDAKSMAQTLREALKAKAVTLSHSESLELVAKALGFHDWNVLSAAIQASQPQAKPKDGGTALPVTPMRDVVFFPQVMTLIFAGRDKTKRAMRPRWPPIDASSWSRKNEAATTILILVHSIPSVSRLKSLSAWNCPTALGGPRSPVAAALPSPSLIEVTSWPPTLSRSRKREQ